MVYGNLVVNRESQVREQAMNTTTATVQIRNITDNTELFCWYGGQSEPQACHLNLDLEDGELFCDYNGNIGSGVSAAVYHRRILTIGIPTLTGEAANELMAEVAPIAQRVLDGASIEWNGNNNVGQLSDEAQAAFEELTRVVEDFTSDAPTVDGIYAADWYAGMDPAEELSLTADTTDEELADMEEVARADIEANANGVVVVQGLDRYLAELRDDLRSQVREALEEAAEQYAASRQTRDRLIRQVAGWDVDSDRAIGALADLTHTAVQKIVKAGQ